MSSTHSEIGASSCERFWECPGSINVFNELPPLPPSIYAAEGTVAHGVAEKYLLSGKPVDDELLGDIIHQEGFGIEVTDNMLEAVTVYVDTINDTLKTEGLSRKRLKVEVGFTLEHLHHDARGTCDAVIERFDIPIIADYKHGAGKVVEVIDNKQTQYYGLGYYYSLPKRDRKHVEAIENIIIQPRAHHVAGVVRRATYTHDEVFEFEEGLRGAINRVRNGDRTLKAGDWCKFCKAKPVCNASRTFNLSTAFEDFADIDIDDSGDSTIPSQAMRDIRSFTPDELAATLRRLPALEEWIDSVKAFAFREADRGVEIPGFMLSHRRSNRRWKDKDRVVDAYEWLFGDLIWEKRLKTPAQLEKMLPKKHRNSLANYWEKPDTGKTLARVEGGNEKLLPSAVSDFIDVDFDD